MNVNLNINNNFMENNEANTFINNLVGDESFITWVKSDFTEDDDIWSDYIDEHMDQMVQINKAIRLVVAIDFVEDNTIDTQKLWERISSVIQIGNSNSIPKPSMLYRAIMIGIAVATFLLYLILRG